MAKTSQKNCEASRQRFIALNKSRAIHNMTDTPTWLTWKAIHSRCKDPNASGYKRYGGRGITICERWKEFMKFYDDMGKRPIGKTIDRINNDGNYEPSNCRWATPSEQAKNRIMPKRGPYKNSKSGYVGVYWNKETNNWRASKKIADKMIHIGMFNSIEEARDAYVRHNSGDR